MHTTWRGLDVDFAVELTDYLAIIHVALVGESGVLSTSTSYTLHHVTVTHDWLVSKVREHLGNLDTGSLNSAVD